MAQRNINSILLAILHCGYQHSIWWCQTCNTLVWLTNSQQPYCRCPWSMTAASHAPVPEWEAQRLSETEALDPASICDTCVCAISAMTLCNCKKDSLCCIVMRRDNFSTSNDSNHFFWYSAYIQGCFYRQIHKLSALAIQTDWYEHYKRHTKHESTVFIAVVMFMLSADIIVLWSRYHVFSWYWLDRYG